MISARSGKDDKFSHTIVTVKIGDIQVDVREENGPLKGIIQTSYKPHSHAANEIYFIEAGSLSIECNGECMELNSGDIFVIRAHVPHHIIRCSEDISRYNLRFLIHSHEPIQDDTVYWHYAPTDAEKDEIFDSVKHLRGLFSNRVGKFELYRMKSHYGILLSYVIGFFLPSHVDKDTESHSRLALYTNIESYIEKNCNTQITLESLANYLNYSKAQTGRILRECYGVSFSRVLRDTRIGIAKRLLAESSVSINEIAARCGYDTRQGFELMFSKYVGITPHAFREQNSVVRSAD